MNVFLIIQVLALAYVTILFADDVTDFSSSEWYGQVVMGRTSIKRSGRSILLLGARILHDRVLARSTVYVVLVRVVLFRSLNSSRKVDQVLLGTRVNLKALRFTPALLALCSLHTVSRK